MIIRFQSIIKEVKARRKCFNDRKTRRIERFLSKISVSFVLGISNLLKYRLKVMSSGDISTVAGLQIPK